MFNYNNAMSKKPPFEGYSSFNSYEEYKAELKRKSSLRVTADKKHPLRITNHAVERYVERTGDHGQVRGDIRDIIREKIKECMDKATLFDGITKAWIDDESYFVIKGEKVLTFVIKGEK